MFDETDMIHSYSRAEAIEDGQLIDVSERAREAGFVVPVAISVAAWHQLVAWNEKAAPHGSLQDEVGRLWDVLSLGAIIAKMHRDSSRFEYVVRVMEVAEHGLIVVPKRAVITIGPGDHAEPVITITLPEED